jgi:hypothetical protein
VAEKYNLSARGAPPSLWMLLDYYGPSATYLGRVPLSTPLPDSATTSRPAIAWSGGDCTSDQWQCRLWLVAEKDGRMKYRVRDDGFWSGWYEVAPQMPPTVTGGPAVVSDTTIAMVLARGAADGRVYWSFAPITCELGVDCAWNGWLPLPNTVTTADDVAATMHSTLFVAVRNEADDRVWYTSLTGAFTWSPWAVIDGLTTDGAPAVASDGSRVAVVAREAGTGAIKVAYVVDGTGPTGWAEISPGTALKPWGTAPAIVRNSQTLQVYVAKAGSPRDVYVAVGVDSEWGKWRRLPSRSTSTRQPAAADVNDDTNLVTGDATGLAEEAAQ